MIPSRSVAGADLSLVMPCFNEEKVIRFTIPRLVTAFERAGYRLELLAVDNGSHDRTGAVIRELADRYPAIVPHRVARNEGYGKGALSGLARASAPWVGIIPADGPVDAEDVVRLYEAARMSDGDVIAKVHRRHRLDGWQRRLISLGYNLLMRLLWPGLGCGDVNGSPKLFPRAAFEAMQLGSWSWFLDPEILIKGRYLGLRILEVNVLDRTRVQGRSHVRLRDCWEFLGSLIRFRFSSRLASWRRTVARLPLSPHLGLEAAISVEEQRATREGILHHS